MGIGNFLKGLSDLERAALLKHADEVCAFIRELAIIDGAEFELSLDVSKHPLIVNESLFAEGMYRGEVDERIHRLPHSILMPGVKTVRYRIVDGEKLKHSDGHVYRSDVEQWFQKNRMHLADLTEALLPPARFRLLGKGGSLVVFLKDQPWGVFIERNEGDGERHIHVRGYKHWPSYFRYLGVCDATASTDN